MKKLIISGFLLVGIGSTIWFYKYEILIAALPTIVNISNPVAENKSIYWSKDTSLNKNLELQKKPNVIIILAVSILRARPLAESLSLYYYMLT